MKRCYLNWYSLLLVFAMCNKQNTFAEVLFDVSFEAPKHLAGDRPNVGGKDAPSQRGVGRPTIQSAAGGFSSQYLEFRGSGQDGAIGSEEDVRFLINTDAAKYRIEFDMIVDALPQSCCETFAVIAYGSSWNNEFAFRGGRKIGYSYQSLSEGAGGGLTQQGNLWPEDTMIHFRATIDMNTHQWTIFLNGEPAQSERPYYPFRTDPGAPFQSIKFYYEDDRPFGDSSVGVDNILILAVPEPSSILLAAGLVVIAVRRRNPRR